MDIYIYTQCVAVFALGTACTYARMLHAYYAVYIYGCCAAASHIFVGVSSVWHQNKATTHTAHKHNYAGPCTPSTYMYFNTVAFVISSVPHMITSYVCVATLVVQHCDMAIA